MALLIDSPRWPAHGRLWAHLVSDTSLAELHAFAAVIGIPARSFEGDHYDVPAERHGEVVAAGAVLVEGRELVKALQRSGLRLPKRKGERVLATWPQASWPAGRGHRVDCIASTLVPVGVRLAGWLLAVDDEGRLALDGDRLPAAGGGEPRVGYLRVRTAPSQQAPRSRGSTRRCTCRSGRPTPPTAGCRWPRCPASSPAALVAAARGGRPPRVRQTAGRARRPDRAVRPAGAGAAGARPGPAPDGVVVQVAATGLCRSDWHAWRGHDPDVVLPHVPGHELVGTVAAAGADVRRWRVGDRVTVPFVMACGACEVCAAGDGQVCPTRPSPASPAGGRSPSWSRSTTPTPTWSPSRTG